MEKYLLTDFTTERWIGTDFEKIKSEIDNLNDIINKIGILYGELGSPSDLNISVKNVSHCFKNFSLVDGKVYGEVNFLKNVKGEEARNLIKNKSKKFVIRCNGKNNLVTKIFTWDIN